MLAYALDATAPQVEERCRQLRNVAPASDAGALRAWERRGLTVLRNDAHGTMTFSLELPIADGELLTKPLDRAVERGEAELGAHGRELARRTGRCALGRGAGIPRRSARVGR